MYHYNGGSSSSTSEAVLYRLQARVSFTATDCLQINLQETYQENNIDLNWVHNFPNQDSKQEKVWHNLYDNTDNAGIYYTLFCVH